MLRIRAFCASVVVLAALCTSGYAATLTVTNINDSGAGSLRDTLASAASGDTIAFAPGVTGSIPLLSTLTIAQSVTIKGPGAANLTLDGQSTVAVMAITAGTVSISEVTIANGKTAGWVRGSASQAGPR